MNYSKENIFIKMTNICRNPTSGKVMNAPREYYPVGYEKNFDDHFQSKVDLPDTNFHCGDQKYFPGLYGDEQLGCMVRRINKTYDLSKAFASKIPAYKNLLLP